MIAVTLEILDASSEKEYLENLPNFKETRYKTLLAKFKSALLMPSAFRVVI